MDFSKLLSKITLLEAITMADIQTAVGQEKDEQKRAAILNDIAWKENLPGLYDPVSGYFVRKQSMPQAGEGSYSIAATAREADTQALAKLGLVPGSARTSALGGLVGTGSFSNTADQNAAAEKAVKDQSGKVYGGQASDKFAVVKVKQLNDLVAKLTGKPTAGDKIGADAAAYNAAKAGTVQQGAQKVQQGAQKAAPKLPVGAKGWDSQVKESLQSKMASLLNEEFGIEERVTFNPDGTRTPSFADQMTANGAQPSPEPAQTAVVPLNKRFDPRFKNGPEPYTIDIGGVVYKFAGRDKDAPGGGEIIKVPAAVIGIRGLGAVSVELGKDGLYYPAPQQESLAESMGALRDLLSQLEEGEVANIVGKQVGREVAKTAAKDSAEAGAKAIGNNAKTPFKFKTIQDITDVEEKKKLTQWLAANPGKTAGAGIAALGLGVAGVAALDASGRKNALPAGMTQAQVDQARNAVEPDAVAQAAQAAPSASGQSGATGWRQIYDMNKDVIGSNPNLIKPGQQLKMPDGSTYTVKPGDNLSRIAKGVGAAKPADKPTDTPVDKPADTPVDKPAAVTGPTPEQAELIKQIQATMAELEGNESPAVMTALSNAQTAIDGIGKAPAAAPAP